MLTRRRKKIKEGAQRKSNGLEDQKKRALTRDEKALGLLGYVFRLRKGFTYQAAVFHVYPPEHFKLCACITLIDNVD